jgi:hypothetical protein
MHGMWKFVTSLQRWETWCHRAHNQEIWLHQRVEEGSSEATLTKRLRTSLPGRKKSMKQCLRWEDGASVQPKGGRCGEHCSQWSVRGAWLKGSLTNLAQLSLAMQCSLSAWFPPFPHSITLTSFQHVYFCLGSCYPKDSHVKHSDFTVCSEMIKVWYLVKTRIQNIR